jgi:hypothetical protein
LLKSNDFCYTLALSTFKRKRVLLSKRPQSYSSAQGPRSQVVSVCGEGAKQGPKVAKQITTLLSQTKRKKSFRNNPKFNRLKTQKNLNLGNQNEEKNQDKNLFENASSKTEKKFSF